MEVRASSSDCAHEAMRANRAPFRSGATASPSRHTNLNADAANLEGALLSLLQAAQTRRACAGVFMHAVKTSATAARASASAPPNHKGSLWGGGAATYILDGVVVANCVSSSAALRTSPYLSIRAEKWRRP